MSLELLELGLNFMGGLMGQRGQRKAHDKQLAQSQKQFDAQMDTSVQRRVADAKLAGVHPLFAMGASSGASPTITSGGAPRGRPMQDAMQKMASTLGVIEGNRAAAKRDEAQAMLFDSERARINQELNSRGQDSISEVRTNRDYYGPDSVFTDKGTVLGPAEYVSPIVSKSQSRGVRAGEPPLFVKVQTPGGVPVETYNPELGLDEVGQAKYLYEVAKQKVSDRMTTAARERAAYIQRFEKKNFKAWENDPRKIQEGKAYLLKLYRDAVREINKVTRRFK